MKRFFLVLLTACGGSGLPENSRTGDLFECTLQTIKEGAADRLKCEYLSPYGSFCQGEYQGILVKDASRFFTGTSYQSTTPLKTQYFSGNPDVPFPLWMPIQNKGYDKDPMVYPGLVQGTSNLYFLRIEF